MFAVLAAAHAALLLTMPMAAVIAVGLWWNTNTISHNFIHRPFFRRRIANQAFAACLSVLNGIPQSLWRDRHLAHHVDTRSAALLGPRDAGLKAPRDSPFSREATLQTALVLSVWAAMASRSPTFFLATYLPGYLGGLALCALHGYYEHARGTTSHYGRLYNFLLFNDGFHVEHHANPGLPWNRLPAHRAPAAPTSRGPQRGSGVGVESRWPAPLRWMECAGLDSLERLVLKSRALQRLVLRAHFRAMRSLIGALPPVERVAIVGGGLFPRSGLILNHLLPSARITIVDASLANLERARALVDTPNVDMVHARYTGECSDRYDLVVIPLSFDGDRTAVYAHPPAAAVLVHDWIWRKRGDSRIVSFALLKRINLVRR